MSNNITPEDEGTVQSSGISRRKFLIGTGGVLGAAALFGASNLTSGELLGLQIAKAQSITLNSDMDILMFALTLEHIEDAAYRAANASGLLSGRAADYFKAFGDHEHQHVVALTDTIQKLGGTPVAEQASYNFPNFTSQADIVSFFATVEEVGAGAYLGAAPLIMDKNLLAAAASIHDVEGMHASVLRAFMGDTAPSPAFAAPKTLDEVLAAVGPLLTMTSGGSPAGMPTTGRASSNDLMNPLLVSAGVGAVALGAMLHIRNRNTTKTAEESSNE